MPAADLTLLDGVRWRGDVVPGERAGALLAALALAAPRAVAGPDLVAAVWGDDVPDHPDNALQVQVSRLRARTDPDAVVRVGPGYRLGLREDQVDVLHLRRLLVTAREAWAAGDLDVVRHAAAQALAQPVPAGASDGPLADLVAGAARDRDAAGLLLGRVLLARGDSAQALALLEPALGDAPQDESLLAEVLRAEADTRGVPAALARYAAYAARVRDAVGSEPGEALRRLHAELLARDAPVREGLRYDAAPMVGRDGALADLRALLEGARVVSIVGPGGLGKTRMAHLVGRLAARPVVHVVELAGVRSPEGVLPEVATALGVRESVAAPGPAVGQRGTDLRARVAERLAGPPTLLVLDNCEHVVRAVADLVAFLVATTDGTQVLTTSRAPLGIAAEQVYLLAQLGDDDAVELFARRARAARSGVRLERGEVGALVARLDGLPLAIELAAAKVRVMSVAEIAGRLDDRFALLVGTDRSAPDRHRTLEAVISWSWNLLRAEDQAVMRWLAVFPDGFTLEAAQALLGADPMAALAELVDQSLVVVLEDDAGIAYRLLETVREYSLERLADAGESDAARDRLRAWARERAATWAARLYSVEQVDVMAAITREVGNLAAVLRAALADADVPTMVPVLELLAGYWSIKGDHLTVLGLTRPALDVLLADPRTRAGELPGLAGALGALLVTEAIFANGLRPDGLALLARQAVVPGTRTAAVARLLSALDPSDARGAPVRPDVLEELLADDDVQVRRMALMWTCQARENAGDLAGARRAGEQALLTCDDQDGVWTRALICSQLAGLEVQLGADWTAARRYAEQAVPLLRSVGALEDVLQQRSLLALSDVAAGRLDRARAAFDAIDRDQVDVPTLGWNTALVGRAELALAEGDGAGGLALFREGLASEATSLQQARDIDVDLSPWTLYGVSATLFTGATNGLRDAVADLAAEVRLRLPRSLAADGRAPDLPVVGCAVAALGAYELAGPGADVGWALRCFALAHHLGYQRMLPSMAWSRIEGLAEAAAPGRLAAVLGEDAGRTPRDLVPAVLALLA